MWLPGDPLTGGGYVLSGAAPHRPRRPRRAWSLHPTPDGVRYLALAGGERVPRPFHFRWLVPVVCRDAAWRWQAVTVVSVVLTAVAAGLLAPSWEAGLAAGLMLVALPGIRYSLSAPVLVDAPALCLAAWAGVAGDWWLAVVLACVAGACKETGPVFAAAFAWSPWPLVGLVVVAARALMRPGPDDPIRRVRTVTPQSELAWIARHPFRAGWKYHDWRSPLMVLPWGGALAALGHLDWQVVVVLVLAYAQLLVATDTVRLYQWAAPVVCVAAATAVPVAWLPLLVVATVWNPFAGNGV